MKKTIGNLALVIGVIISSLAAGESQRVSRVAALDSTLVGEALHAPQSSHYARDFPDIYVYLDQTLEAGTVLDQQAVDWLRSQDLEGVLVKRRAIETEILAVDEELVGHVFSRPVVLSAEEEEILAGRRISQQFIDRLEASRLTSVRVQLKMKDAEDSNSTHKEEIDWSLDGGTKNPEGVSLLGGTLREMVALPVQLKAESYVDEVVLQRLKDSSVSEVSVKIPRTWTWQGWGARWIFMIGIGITIMGVFLKRVKLDAQALEAEQLEVARLGELLQELEGTVARLAAGADEMDAETIQREVNPLLLGPIYSIAEGRNSIRKAHGGRVFASVMDAFSRGERKLNRTWSAAVDGYPQEARRCLHSALPALREAREALPGTHPPHPGGFDERGAPAPLPPDVPLVEGDSHWSDD